jgi:hypothetical protein
VVVVAATTSNLPIAQTEVAVHEVATLLVWTKLAGQAVHDVALVVVEKVPAVQLEQTTLVVGVAATIT